MLLMEADTRNDPRTILQFVNEEVIGGGYKILELNCYETIKVMRDPSAPAEGDMSYRGAAADFEEAMAEHPEIFELRIREDIDHVYFFSSERRCVLEVMF